MSATKYLPNSVLRSPQKKDFSQTVKTQSLGLYYMDRDVIGARSALTSVKGSAKGSPRSSILAESATPSKTFSTKPTLQAQGTIRAGAKTDLDKIELDFDSCYKYPIEGSHSATKVRAGSTFKGRVSPSHNSTFQNTYQTTRGSPYIKQINQKDSQPTSSVSPLNISSMDIDLDIRFENTDL